MKIVGFNGSLSLDSNTYKGIKAVLETAKENGAAITLFDLRNNPLPMYDPEQSDAIALKDENVQLLRTLLDEADGIILGSPEYHGGMSGAFKNAMDWLGSTQFKNKPVALVSSAGGPSSMNTLNSMQIMIRNLHGWVIPVLGSIPGGTKFTSEGLFMEDKLKSRFNNIGIELIGMAGLLMRNK